MQRRNFLAALSGVAASPWLARPGRAADDAAGPAWTYNPGAPNGPERWGELPGYGVCATGRKQSPIELVDGSFVMPMIPIRLNWATMGGIVFDDPGHHSVKVEVAAGKLTTTIGTDSYDVAEYHVHVPSEHVLRGVHRPMEVHVKHTPKDGITLVVGVMIEQGTGSAPRLFEQILKAKQSISGEPVRDLRNGTLVPSEKQFGFFRYGGSLTTPACNETVDWVVLDTPAAARISPAELHELQRRYGPPQGMPVDQTILARPPQPTNGRVVRWYKP